MFWKSVITVSCLLLLTVTADAVPPVPAVIAGTVTINGNLLTQAEDNGYTIEVTRPDGGSIASAFGGSASDIDGLSSMDWYWIDLPLHDAADQPDGAVPGDAGVIHVYHLDRELTVITPENGQVAIGVSGSRTRIDISVVDPEGNDEEDPHDVTTPFENPQLLFPMDSQPGVSVTPELAVGKPVMDSNPSARHIRTQWQVAEDQAFLSPVLDIVSPTNLTALPLPHHILDENTTYYWRVRFFDDAQETSAWADSSWFTTLASRKDISPANGVPDFQDVDNRIDLDNNGTPDIDQQDMKSVRTVIGNAVMGVKISKNVAEVISLVSLSPSDITGGWHTPGGFGIGVISFKVSVYDADAPAVVTIYLSSPAPGDARWFKFDMAAGWEDYSESATFSTDRTSFSLKLRDGGPGDADGVKNNMIIDPGGLVYVDTQQPFQASGDSDGRKGSDGGGCFIMTTNDLQEFYGCRKR